MKTTTRFALMTACLAFSGGPTHAQESKPAGAPAAGHEKATQVAPPPKSNVRLPQVGKTLVLPKGKPVSVTGLTLKGGVAVKEDSVVTLTWDDKGLEVVFDNTDSAIASQFATTRDSEKFWKDDSVELFLDIGHRHDGRTPATQPIEIALSVAGGLLDCRGRDVSYNIEGIESEVNKTEKGWQGRIRIPWKGLGTEPKLNEAWGLNLGRIDHEGKTYANTKHISWSPYGGDDFKEVNEWGHVIFVAADASPEGEAVKAAIGAIEKKHAEVAAATIFPQPERTVVLAENESVKVAGFVNMNTDASELQQTQATLKWTAEGMEVVFDCVDSAIAAVYSEHDAIKMWKDDSVTVWLDPGHKHDARGGMLQIMCSATGAVHDIRDGDPKFDVEGLKSSAVRTEKGWQATIVIPWKGLGVAPPKPGEVWGFNLSRTDQPGVWDYTRTDLTTWAPGAKDGEVDRWGHIIFVPAKTGAQDPVAKQGFESIEKTHAARRHAIVGSQPH